MELDLYLINQVKSLSNGRFIHHTENLIAAYKGCYNFALDVGTEESVELFRESEAEMRKFIAERRLEQLKNSDYENIEDLNKF